MRKVLIWLVEFIALAIVVTLLRQVSWDTVLDYFKRGVKVTADKILEKSASSSEPRSSSEKIPDAPTPNQHAAPRPSRESDSDSLSRPGSEYFPEDTPRLRYEYLWVLSENVKLRMIEHVDDIIAFNNHRYYKEVAEVVGFEELITLLKHPNPASDKEADFFQSKEVADFIKFMEQVKRTVTYSRWDETGAYSVHDDLTKPEFAEPPFPVGIGSKWTDGNNMLNRAVGVEDVDVRAGSFKNCLTVHSSSSDNPGMDTTEYMAPGIGLVKLLMKQGASTITLTLVKYQR